MTSRSRTIVEFAPAKVNLALHVLQRRADGYHELDSLVAFVPQVADVVRVSPARACSLKVNGPLADGIPSDARNLALRAATALIRRWPQWFAPVRITLEKHLPAAAGIGGGSSDAAAVIRAMCRLFAVTPESEALTALALELGADVPVCLHGRAARMQGIGERLTPLALPTGLGVVLANPKEPVATGRVFAHLAAMRRQGMHDRHPPVHLDELSTAWRHDGEGFLTTLQAMRNDLEAPACAIAPGVDACLQALHALPDARLTRMSGSGATCFALFTSSDAAQKAAQHLRLAHPNWWIASGTLQ